MFWNIQHETEKDFDDWQAQEKYERAQAFYKEVGQMHGRIKERLFNLFILSVLLCGVSTFGVHASTHYAFSCGILMMGFSMAIPVTVCGLWKTSILTINVSPQTIDTFLETSPQKTKAAGQTVLAFSFAEIANHNARQAVKDRKYLQTAWITLVSTPLFAWAMSLIIHT